jgi:TolA-binding protein
MRTTKCLRLSVLALPLFLFACQSTGGKDTIAKLRAMRIEIKEEKIEGELDKAMESYQRFLKETPKSSALNAEAIRRLADLKIEREYGYLSGDAAHRRAPGAALTPPELAARQKVETAAPSVPAPVQEQTPGESQTEFEKRAARAAQMPGTAAREELPVPGVENLERADAREAIALYQKLLAEYPRYERNDQVLYQMSRAYEELGQVDEAMQVMDRLVREYPKSRYIDEVQFRRAEYFFTRRHYLDAEDAYKSVVDMGGQSSFYQLALYKLGWTFYKQELYEEALDRYMALLDYKVATGYDFSQTKDEMERKRIDDTFRVISLCFSNVGGSKSVVEYFTRVGHRSYEDGVYSNLGEFYYDKRRYSDAAATYSAFISRNPFHKASPQYHMRVIEIDIAGGFPTLVIDAKKEFARNYGLTAEYWQHFDPSARPEVLAWLKTNLTDLAKHYHALYQNPEQIKNKRTNFDEALQWYRAFLASFPKDPESPAVNYLLADLLLENGSFDLAAVEYEKTAYEYPQHEKSSQAGYAAVYAHRQHLAGVTDEAVKDQVRREAVRSSLMFAYSYPEHEKAAIVLGEAANDLYEMREYEMAATSARRLIEGFPGADAGVVRAAWLVAGHSTYELRRYNEAETAYAKVLALLPAGDKNRDALVDNLAASIYKQGEQANANKEYRAAADHFLRVGRLAPTSKIRVNAEYDAATALMQLKDWKAAAAVLTTFRDLFPGHALQPEVTKKIAYVYREDGQLALAADEYERMERESQDDEVRRDALLIAAELHEKTGNQARTLAAYRRYIDHFPHPVESNLEMRNKIAEVLKKSTQENYLAELRQIVVIDAGAEGERTPRTRYLAGKAALVLTMQSFDQFTGVKLVEPFKANLDRKKELMKVATQQFNSLLDYEIGEVTAAATFYLAEIYADFSKDLKESERPTGLNALEREEYELAIEDQAYPFEEKAIATHKSNLELISRGVYNEWIDKSLQKLAEFVPSRYDKPEEESPVIVSLDSYQFALERPEPPAPQAPHGAAPDGEAQQPETREAVKEGEPKPSEANEGVKTEAPKQDARPAETKEAVKAESPKQGVQDGGSQAGLHGAVMQ